MPVVIHMTAPQAASVTGKSPTANAMIVPVALTDSTFIVGPEVLADPAFADRKALLLVPPQVDYATLVAVLPVSLSVAAVSVGSAMVDTP